jgi:hypothetical protein
VGTGKSVQTKKLLEMAYLRGWKVIDLADLGRLENVFYSLPNEATWMYDRFFETMRKWKKKKQQLFLYKEGKLKKEEVYPWAPQTFPVECFIPAVPETTERLPSVFKPFRILFRDLELEEVRILLGKLTRDQSEAVDHVWYGLPASRKFEDFMSRLEDLVADSRVRIKKKRYEICDDKQSYSLFKKADRLNQLGIISDDKNDPLLLHLDDIMKDTKTISSFSFFNVRDDNVIYLLYGFLLRKIYAMRDEQIRGFWTYPELAIGIREIQNIAPSRGQTGSFTYEGQRISTESLIKISREPRDVKIRIIADSQDPGAINPTVRGKFTTIHIFRVNRKTLTQLEDLLYIDRKTYNNIQNVGPGFHAVRIVPNEKNIRDKTGLHYPILMKPPRSWCKKPEDLFFKIWQERGYEFKTWKFEEIVSRLVVESNKEMEEKEALTFPQEAKKEMVLKLIIRAFEQRIEKTVPSINTLMEDETLKLLGIPKGVICSVVEELTAAGRVTRVKRGRSWKCTLVDPPPSVVVPAAQPPIII